MRNWQLMKLWRMGSRPVFVSEPLWWGGVALAEVTPVFLRGGSQSRRALQMWRELPGPFLVGWLKGEQVPESLPRGANNGGLVGSQPLTTWPIGAAPLLACFACAYYVTTHPPIAR